jgi:hypothetical protein
MKMEYLELTDEMVERIDEIDNAVYDLILTLAEKTPEDLEWDMAIIGNVTDSIKTLLWEEFQIKVRHPAVVTNKDGTQYFSEYDFE